MSSDIDNFTFECSCGTEKFALAHNGVLWNDKELRREHHLPATEIETDSYIAVQLLEQVQHLDSENIKRMAELVEGSFAFTILRNDGTLLLVKGSNPLTIYHFPESGLYVYASTKSILGKALKKSALTCEFCEIDVSEGDILELSPDGKISKSTFEVKDKYRSFLSPYNWCSSEYADWWEKDEREQMLMEYCCMFGVSEEDVQLLLDFGYDTEEIEQMLMDTDMLEDALNEIRNAFCVE